AYRKHVQHAAGMLARFGILAAIVPNGFKMHGDDFLFDILTRGEWSDLGEGRFEGTKVGTSVIFMENDPDRNWREKPHETYSNYHAWATALAVSSDADV